MLARSFTLVALLACASCSDDTSSGEAGGGSSPTGGSPGTGGAGAAGAGSDGGAGGLSNGGAGEGGATGGGAAEGGAPTDGGGGSGGSAACANADGTYTGSYSWTFQYNDTTTVCTGELTVTVAGEDISGDGHCMFDTGTEWDSTMTGTVSPGGAAEGSFTPGVGLSLGSTTWTGALTCEGGFVLTGELAPKQRGGNLTEGDFSVGHD